MVPTLVYIHFGKWNELLAANEPDQKLVYANILYHFGRGMAFAHQTKTSDARNELLQMQMLMKDSGLYLPFGIFSPAIDGARVAEHLLKGSIWLAEKKYPAALEAFTKAATVEEHMVYTEPRDWLLNPKHYLGNALMAAGKPLDAQNVFEKDLLNNKENGWALFGIYQSLLAQKKNGAAEKMLERFNKAFSKSDVKIPGPVF
jgi:tetratricopeptide (TPR) repeat protein